MNNRQIIMYYQNQTLLKFKALDLGNDNHLIIECQNDLKKADDVQKVIKEYFTEQNFTLPKDAKIIFDSKLNLSYIVNLSKMNRFKVKKSVYKELESVFNNIDDYEVLMNIHFNKKNYFSVYCNLILKSELKYIKDILKNLKIKNVEIVLKNDLYKKHFSQSNYVTFEKSDQNVLLGMGNSNDYKSLLIKDFDEFKYNQAMNILLTYFALDKEEFDNLLYFYIQIDGNDIENYNDLKNITNNLSIEKIDFFSQIVSNESGTKTTK